MSWGSSSKRHNGRGLGIHLFVDMKSLAIDISLTPGNPYNGIGMHTRGLIMALADLPEAAEWNLYAVAAANQDVGPYQLPERAQVLRLPAPTRERGAAIVSHQWHLRGLLASNAIQVYHAPGNSIVLSAPTPPVWMPRGVSRVVTVHDVIPLRFPEVYPVPGFSRFVRKAAFKAYVSILARTGWIVTSSRSSAGDLLRHAHARSERLRVIPLAADRALVTSPNDPARLDPRLRRTQYMLHVGTGNRNKNIPAVLRVFSQVRDRSPELLVKLVMVGPYTDDLLFREHCPRYIDDVLVMTGVSTPNLAALYRNASVFLFPSLYEGFGLPVLEALALSCPVVCSNTSSLPEVAGDAGLLCAPDDVSALTEAALRVLRDAVLAKEMRRRGLLHAAQFNWKAVAEAHLSVYDAAIKRVETAVIHA